MRSEVRKMAIHALRWTIGLVVLCESLRLAFAESAIHNFARTGMPPWLRPALAWPEIFAAVLFVVPMTELAGAYLLLTIFALAALLHFLHGQYDISPLILYTICVLVVLAHRNVASTEVVRE